MRTKLVLIAALLVLGTACGGEADDEAIDELVSFGFTADEAQCFVDELRAAGIDVTTAEYTAAIGGAAGAKCVADASRQVAIVRSMLSMIDPSAINTVRVKEAAIGGCVESGVDVATCTCLLDAVLDSPESVIDYLGWSVDLARQADGNDPVSRRVDNALATCVAG